MAAQLFTKPGLTACTERSRGRQFVTLMAALIPEFSSMRPDFISTALASYALGVVQIDCNLARCWQRGFAQGGTQIGTGTYGTSGRSIVSMEPGMPRSSMHRYGFAMGRDNSGWPGALSTARARGGLELAKQEPLIPELVVDMGTRAVWNPRS